MDKKRIGFIGTYIIIFAVSFLSILVLEAINAEMHLDLMEEYVKIPQIVVSDTYNLSNIKFKRVYLNEKYPLKDRCSKGCNLSVSRNKRTVYYMIEKRDDGYYYKMAVNSRLLLEDKFLGKEISNAYIDYYLNNIVLFNTIDSSPLVYDYMNIINRDYLYEEIESIGANSIELTDNGIIYMTSSCRTGTEEYDHLIKNRRVLFTKDLEVLSDENATFSWCA